MNEEQGEMNQLLKPEKLREQAVEFIEKKKVQSNTGTNNNVVDKKKVSKKQKEKDHEKSH